MPRPRRCSRAAALALAAAVTWALAGCTPTAPMPVPSASATVVTPAARLGDGVLRIGTLFPRSGALKFLGPAQVAGVDAAVREINAAGGVGGAPVEVIHSDAGEPGSKTGETSFAALIEKKADVVIGPSTSALALSLLPTAVKAEVPLISPAATLPELAAADDSGYLFRTIPSFGLQGMALAELLSAKGPVRVALLYTDDGAGRALAESLPLALESTGSSLVVATGIAPDASKFDTAAVAEAKPDAVVLATAGATTLTKAIISGLAKAKLAGSKLWLTSQNLSDYSQALPRGTLTDANGLLEGATPSAALEKQLKREDAGLTSFRYAAEAYDATILAALAATLAMDDAGERLASAIQPASANGITCATYAECLEVLKTDQDLDYGGVSGPVTLAADGDVLAGYYGVYRYSSSNKYVVQSTILAGDGGAW